MNLLSSHFLQAQSTPDLGNVAKNLGVESHGQNVPKELIELLGQGKVDENIDFDQLLKLVKKGHDPQEVLKTISSEGAKTKSHLSLIGSDDIKNTEIKATELNIKDDVQLDELVGHKLKQGDLIDPRLARPVNSEKSGALKTLEGKHAYPARDNQSFFVRNPSQSMNLSSVNNNQNLLNTNPIETKEQFPEMIKSMETNNVTSKLDSIVKNTHRQPVSLFQKSNPTLKQIKLNKLTNVKKSYPSNNHSLFKAQLENVNSSLAKDKVAKTPLKEFVLNKADEGILFDERPLQVSSMVTKNTSLQQASMSQKVFDLGAIEGAANEEEIINKVQDYIIQAKAKNVPEVKLRFHHEKIGDVDLMVQKNEMKQFHVEIAPKTLEGIDFFTKNQKELINTLSKSGVKLAEFKIDNSQNHNMSQQDSSKNQSFTENKGFGQHHSQSGQRDQDARRREELWQNLLDKEAA